MTAKDPFISRITEIPLPTNHFDARDSDCSEDSLGAAVELGADGLVVAAVTRLTEVRHETTDDN
jgi:hypothetical protein